MTFLEFWNDNNVTEIFVAGNGCPGGQTLIHRKQETTEKQMTASEQIARIDSRIQARQQMVDICRSNGDTDGVRCHQMCIDSLMHSRIQIHDSQVAPIRLGAPV